MHTILFGSSAKGQPYFGVSLDSTRPRLFLGNCIGQLGPWRPLGQQSGNTTWQAARVRSSLDVYVYSIHVYICIFANMYVYMYTYTYIDMCVYIYTCVYMCIYIYTGPNNDDLFEALAVQGGAS